MTKEDAIRNLFCRVLQEIDAATTEMETDETDSGIIHYPNFRYTPTFEFTDEDIELIKWLAEEEGEAFDMLTQ